MLSNVLAQIGFAVVVVEPFDEEYDGIEVLYVFKDSLLWNAFTAQLTNLAFSFEHLVDVYGLPTISMLLVYAKCLFA